jgi:ribosome-associated toxin RatA of RatAB toxin-antitoxin module
MSHFTLQPPFRCALLAGLAVLLLGADAPERTVSTPTGDVRVSLTLVRPDGPREGIGRGLVEAPPERVFRALQDVEHWHEFMPFLEQSTARRRKDGSVESFQRLELPFPVGRRSYRVQVRSRVERAAGGTVWHIDWTYVPESGNVKDHHGSWALTTAPNGATLATLRLYTHPGGFMPASAVDRGTAETLPWIFHGLRQHVLRARYDDSKV